MQLEAHNLKTKKSLPYPEPKKQWSPAPQKLSYAKCFQMLSSWHHYFQQIFPSSSHSGCNLETNLLLYFFCNIGQIFQPTHCHIFYYSAPSCLHGHNPMLFQKSIEMQGQHLRNQIGSSLWHWVSWQFVIRHPLSLYSQLKQASIAWLFARDLHATTYTKHSRHKSCLAEHRQTLLLFAQ